MNSVASNNFYTTGSLGSVIPQLMINPNCDSVYQSVSGKFKKNDKKISNL